MPDRHASSGAVGAPAASARAALRLSVLLPLPLAGVYDYLAPRASLPAPGEFVIVPLGNRQLLGVAWGEATNEVAAAKLKTVIERLPAPPMRDELRRLIDWVASYTLAPPGAVLRMAMSVPDALEPARMLVGYALSERGRTALAAACSRRWPMGRPRRQRIWRAVPAAARAWCAAWPRLAWSSRSTCRVARCRRRPTGGGRVLISPRRSRRRPTISSPSWRKAASASPCSMASPARARPRSISPRSRRRWRAASRC